MVRDCLPWAPQFLKALSRLKATRGRYPKSSRRVNSGKNMAIGGSITETTQAVVLYIPSTINETMKEGHEMLVRNSSILPSITANIAESAEEG